MTICLLYNLYLFFVLILPIEHFVIISSHVYLIETDNKNFSICIFASYFSTTFKVPKTSFAVIIIPVLMHFCTLKQGWSYCQNAWYIVLTVDSSKLNFTNRL